MPVRIVNDDAAEDDNGDDDDAEDDMSPICLGDGECLSRIIFGHLERIYPFNTSPELLLDTVP